ncbi:3-deoxy-7-phosphoheptulonate synthase [uncultured Slackia sp.]|uniref:3-deoxy-7-phosphoheptulonate synthase n=1 Tax=uncultured Slackia sp. TaxID=665903 RepID=UPI0026E06543|nr:3-deoxy-7-phosphoheptulonate synthase [uncultured Slackia sp.]
MIVIVREAVAPEGLDELCGYLRSQNVQPHVIIGEKQTVVGLIGDTTSIDIHHLESMDQVAAVRRVSEPFKKANRKFHPDDTVIEVGGVKFGGGNFGVMAGPCSVESEEQCMTIAESVKKAGATVFRGGAFKPRTSPYAFQGMGEEGLAILSKVKREFGMPIVSEIMDARDLPLFDDIDILQVGARNMQNFTLLKELGKTDKPILLKRGLAATIDELLMAAEYIMAGGNERVMLCERGIRSYDTRTRNVFDVSAVPVLRDLTHLPIIADPSHATGYTRLVPPVAYAATAAGADGLEVEVHHDPAHAASDGAQALLPEQFDEMMRRLSSIRAAVVDPLTES